MVWVVDTGVDVCVMWMEEGSGWMRQAGEGCGCGCGCGWGGGSGRMRQACGVSSYDSARARADSLAALLCQTYEYV